MACTCVVGLQWGDEAKGKIVDLLTDDHAFVVRYNGGANAGHTVVSGDQTFKLSLLPTGILRPHVRAVIGNGVVVYPPRFLEETANLRKGGIAIGDNLVVSDRAHVIFPYHLEEERLNEGTAGKGIGTTGRGIGPCYQDKVGRQFAVRLGELLHPEHLRERLGPIVERKNRLLRALSADARQFDADTICRDYLQCMEQIRPHVADTTHLLHEAMRKGQGILFEAAQGSLLDVDHGTYPFVTSSNSSTAGVWSGSGVPARRLDRVVGVIKAYSTRVGRGPFPTELDDGPNGIGERIRKTGREYGTVTGRPRRCGWFDAVATRVHRHSQRRRRTGRHAAGRARRVGRGRASPSPTRPTAGASTISPPTPSCWSAVVRSTRRCRAGDRTCPAHVVSPTSRPPRAATSIAWRNCSACRSRSSP